MVMAGFGHFDMSLCVSSSRLSLVGSAISAKSTKIGFSAQSVQVEAYGGVSSKFIVFCIPFGIFNGLSKVSLK